MKININYVETIEVLELTKTCDGEIWNVGGRYLPF